MKLVLVSAHFPPSNLAGVHRARLIANQLVREGMDVTVLTIDAGYYEEKLEPQLLQLVDSRIQVIRVPAVRQSLSRPMGWGDIGLRGFKCLHQKLSQMARDGMVDLIHIMIPSNYQALLGRMIWDQYRVPYIIDYIDPWVHESDLGEAILSKGWMSQKLARILEPVAVKNTSGISGITDGYMKGVISRNSHLKDIPTLAFQYGCDVMDFEKIQTMQIPTPSLKFEGHGTRLVYAGALLPRAHEVMRVFLRALSQVNQHERMNHPLYLVCLGTGSSPMDSTSYQVLPLAREVGAEKWVREYSERRPYLEVLATLQKADGILIAGSTEPHYSPSKVFQSILARRPVLALLHRQSKAVEILMESGGGNVLVFDSKMDASELLGQCREMLICWPPAHPPRVNWEIFEKYNISSQGKVLIKFYEKVLEWRRGR